MYFNLYLDNAEEIIRPSSSKISESIQIGEDLFSKGFKIIISVFCFLFSVMYF